MHRYKFSTTYRGPSFAGWSRSNDPRSPGVCNSLDAALRKTAGDLPITVVGAGRTDAGVHGLSQQTHVDILRQKRIPPTRQSNQSKQQFQSRIIHNQHIKPTLSHSVSLFHALDEFTKLHPTPSSSKYQLQMDSHAPPTPVLHDQCVVSELPELINTISRRFPLHREEQAQGTAQGTSRGVGPSHMPESGHGDEKHTSSGDGDPLPPTALLPPSPLVSAYVALHNVKPSVRGKYANDHSFAIHALHPHLDEILKTPPGRGSVGARRGGGSGSGDAHHLPADAPAPTPVSIRHRLETIPTLTTSLGVNIPLIQPPFPPAQLQHIINHQLRNRNSLYDPGGVSVSECAMCVPDTWVHASTTRDHVDVDSIQRIIASSSSSSPSSSPGHTMTTTPQPDHHHDQHHHQQLTLALPYLLTASDMRYLPNHLTPFHSRFDACRRQYQYRVLFAPIPDCFEEHHAWAVPLTHQRRFNLANAQKVATILTGYHDFNSFRAVHCQSPSSVRRLDDITFTISPSFQQQLNLSRESIGRPHPSPSHVPLAPWSSNPAKHTPSFVASCRTALFDILATDPLTGVPDLSTVPPDDRVFVEQFLMVTGGMVNLSRDINNSVDKRHQTASSLLLQSSSSSPSPPPPATVIPEYNPLTHGSILTLTFTARSYLYSQVRILTSAIIAGGLGDVTPDQVQRYLEAKDRLKNPLKTAPAHGLFLSHVLYPSTDTELGLWRKIMHLQRKMNYLSEM